MVSILQDSSQVLFTENYTTIQYITFSILTAKTYKFIQGSLNVFPTET